MAEDTEVPVENAAKAQIISNQNVDIEDEQKLEVRVNETESSMLEDETMPTYLSITSNASSMKPDDSKVQTDAHNADTDDVEIQSIYSVSSDDGGQQSSRAFYAQRRSERSDVYYHDDDDYDESEESYPEDRIGRKRRHDDESDEDEMDDDDEIGDEEEEDEESYGDIEADRFERSSDDFCHRTSNTSLEKCHKERSRSLQELSSPNKSSRFNSKRHGYINSENYNLQIQNINYNDLKHESLTQSKYSHVPSKVKAYIQNIKEQYKKSSLQKSNDKVHFNPYTININQNDENQETDNLLLNPQCKRIKDYAELAMKNIIVEDLSRRQYINLNNYEMPVGNGDEIITQECIKNTDETMEIDEKLQNNKLNGTCDYSANNVTFESQQKENQSVQELIPVINGQEITDTVLDVQTLSYEDYMKGNVDKSHIPDVVSNEGAVETINEEVVITPTVPSSIPPVIETKNIVTKELPHHDDINNKNESDNKPQVQPAKTHDVQCSNEDIDKNPDYKKIIDENLKLKKEIEELKEALAVQQNEMKRKDVKIAAVQTENQPRIMKHTSTTTHLEIPDKLSATIIPDVASTISSIENWTDSAYSPVVSLKPPNVEHLLNSNDSTTHGSPRNSSQSSSRALLTTNRILQTLANITPGKPIPNMVEKRFDNQGQSKDPISPLLSSGLISRKRKASDNFGTSTTGPLPTKIPLTNTIRARRKFNSASDADGAIASAELSNVADTDEPNAAVGNRRDNIQNEMEHHADEETDDDGVKCYVWQENEDTQERSCLIQAPLDASLQSEDVKQPVRECGPYLLGNLEVRISEANGTLNLWGREVNHNSKSKESESINDGRNEAVIDPENFWPKTPKSMVDNQFKCSTTKKIRSPTSVRATASRHLRNSLNRTPSPLNIPVENHLNISNSCQHSANHCNQCYNHKHTCSPPAYNNHINSHVKSPCCGHKLETNIRDCGCRREHEPPMDNPHCHCEIGRHRTFLSPNQNYHCGNHRRNVCINHLPVEDTCKNAACHRLSDSEPEDCCRYVPKRQCHSTEANSYNYPIENICCQGANTHRMEINPCAIHSQEEVNNRNNLQKSHEIPDKRNWTRGKRVRSIMEFLTSCGDSRNTETSSIDDSCQIPETDTANTRSVPNIRINSASPSTTAYPKHLNNSSDTQKKCNSCVNHAGTAAELEAELEIIRVEISKLHSRSNAMRVLLQRVLQTDANTPT